MIIYFLYKYVTNLTLLKRCIVCNVFKYKKNCNMILVKKTGQEHENSLAKYDRFKVLGIGTNIESRRIYNDAASNIMINNLLPFISY